MLAEPCRNLVILLLILASPFVPAEHMLIHMQHAHTEPLEMADSHKNSCPPHDDEEMELASICAIKEEEEEEKPFKTKKGKLVKISA